MRIPEVAASLEREIVQMKADIGRLTRSRNLALREGRREEGRRHHLAALDTELNHLDALARYVQTMSPAAGRELATRRALAARHFQRLRNAADTRELHQWVVGELAPLLNKSEQAAHLVATSLRARSKGSPHAFMWPVAVESAVRGAATRRPRTPPKEHTD